MVVTEEVDALRTMAIEPIEFVLAPKYLAALIVLPCLTIVSSAAEYLPARSLCALAQIWTLAFTFSTQYTQWFFAT